MKKLFSITFILLSATVSLAQDTYLKWAKQFKGGKTTGFDTGWGLTVDANGNVYTSGHFSGTVDFDPGPGTCNLTAASAENVYISKLDVFGNFLWAKQIAGNQSVTTRTIALDKAFNVYVTGNFTDTVDVDPGPAVQTLISNGGSDVFVLKLSTDGNFLWAKQIGGLSDVTSFSCAADSSGNIYLTGSYRGTADFDPGPGVFSISSATNTLTDVFVCKLDAAGNFVWARSMGGDEQDTGFGISLDVAGNIYVSGRYRNVADFDPGSAIFYLISKGLDDIFILKLDAACNFIWAKSMGGTSIEWAYKVIPDAAGNVYATGFFTGTADFDPGPGVFNLNSLGADAVFVVKLNVAGNFVWAKGMGGPVNNNWGMYLALDKTGNVYTTGFFVGLADFDPGPGVFLLNADVVDIFILKLDNNGNFIWAKSTGSGGIDQGNSITVDDYNNVYVTGHFARTVDFDLETPTYYLTADDSDPFVLKIGQCNLTTYGAITDSACRMYSLNGQTYNASGTYNQILLNTSGCDSIITLNLTITKKYTAVDTAICQGQTYYAGGAFQSASGIYIDSLFTIFGCDSVVTTTLSLNQNPKPNLGVDRVLCIKDALTLSPGTFATYLWQDNSTQASFKVNRNTGKYWVTVFDSNNCTGSDSIIIQHKNCIPIGIPNAFTPNGDGNNDLFKPTINISVQNFSFIIFNHYGQIVFETREYGRGWDGTYKGKEQPGGSYVYRIKFTNAIGWESVENGTVLLIR